MPLFIFRFKTLDLFRNLILYKTYFYFANKKNYNTDRDMKYKNTLIVGSFYFNQLWGVFFIERGWGNKDPDILLLSDFDYFKSIN